MRYLLDTNVVSELRKPRPHGALLSWISALIKADFAVCAATFGELQSGIERTRRNNPEKALELERWVDRLRRDATIVDPDADTFRLWARLMVAQPQQLQMDALIAAVAITNGLTVATRNVKDFAQFNVPVVNPFETA